jgi:hypothetical protein
MPRMTEHVKPYGAEGAVMGDKASIYRLMRIFLYVGKELIVKSDFTRL